MRMSNQVVVERETPSESEECQRDTVAGHSEKKLGVVSCRVMSWEVKRCHRDVITHHGRVKEVEVFLSCY
jgi:hypothetical protein